MSEYQWNPKTKGSRVICCVPQKGRCPVRCSDCFFQPNEDTGESRAYLGKHYELTPNIPSLEQVKGMTVRVNDCNDSNNKREIVEEVAQHFPDKFFNTSIPRNLEGFEYPVVLTTNPGSAKDTDTKAHLVTVPNNLMFVRARVNTWNLDLIDRIVGHYSAKDVPVVLTYMAYYETPIPEEHQKYYAYRARTMNSYWVINPGEWDRIFDRYSDNKLVKTCGADATKFACTDCRNCENLYRTKVEQLGLPTQVDWTTT